MTGWLGAEEVSDGQGDLLASFFPVERRQLGDLLIGCRGQALQDVFEIGIRFDAMQAAVFDERIHHGAARAGFFGAEEEPVLFANGRRPDGILDQVMPRPGLCRVDRLEAQFSVYSTINRVSTRGIIKDSPKRPLRYHWDDTAWASPWFSSIEPESSPSSPTCGSPRRSLIQSRLCRAGNL